MEIFYHSFVSHDINAQNMTVNWNTNEIGLEFTSPEIRALGKNKHIALTEQAHCTMKCII